MINLLGFKRIVLIVVAILISATAGGLWYYYLAPEADRLDKEIRATNGKISAKQTEISALKQEYDKLKDQIVEFNILKEEGFFNAQDRVTARETIRELARQAKLQKVELKLAPGQVVDSPEAREARHSLLSGPMTLRINAMDDVDAYKFIIALQKIFPGYLEFERMFLERRGDLTEDAKKQIMKGESDGLVSGEVSFKWWSLASEQQMGANPYFNPAAQINTTSQGGQ